MCTKLNLNMIIRFSQILILINFIVVLLQLYNLLPGLHSYGYFYDTSTRPSGLSGGAWELPMVIAPFALLLIFLEKKVFNNFILYNFISFYNYDYWNKNRNNCFFIWYFINLDQKKRFFLKFFPFFYNFFIYNFFSIKNGNL